jgi:hypothetical protein
VALFFDNNPIVILHFGSSLIDLRVLIVSAADCPSFLFLTFCECAGCVSYLLLACVVCSADLLIILLSFASRIGFD